MLFVKFALLAAAIGLFTVAAGFVLYDIYLAIELERLLAKGRAEGEASPSQPRPRRIIRWRTAAKLSVLAWLPLLLSLGIAVVPDGEAGVRISQISGVRPGTLYPGTHFVVPLVERLALYDVRDRVYATSASFDPKLKAEVLKVEAREGLTVGLAVVVRYRVDPRRLDYIQANLPQPLEEQIVAPVIASTFREVAPNYVVRDVFASKREEFRGRAAALITERLAGDAIVVKEVMLRQIQLPEEYARGLEGLLLKEQESERMGFETEIQEKRVRIAELEADAAKVRLVKNSEAEAQAHVIQAKAESDSMQYTLPLKQKQIEQSRLEAQARKEATIENAEAAAQAKVIDSKAELERRRLLTDAEANRIRLTSSAEAEQMRLEGVALKANPLLIQKIIAERLSDKVQIMMVPTDGKFFFTNDVLRSAQAEAGDDPPAKPNQP
ncbi:MAG TPA: SPFH domain-containing protein [Candidatus Acidoferrales bacterium]|jgi:regulator of protease activity HflC (stomatin/prohibitin superfamily)|nr:SPFH domain-containing protein [Candidatus Acidoferrales bacterium]